MLDRLCSRKDERRSNIVSLLKKVAKSFEAVEEHRCYALYGYTQCLIKKMCIKNCITLFPTFSAVFKEVLRGSQFLLSFYGDEKNFFNAI